MIAKKEITAVILAGGNSRRMGKDKGFLTLKGQTFVERILKAVRPLVHDCLIVANDSRYERFGVRVVADLILDSGPVGGIQTALIHAKTPYVLVLSCDIPLIETNLLEHLIRESLPTDLNILSVNGKQQPLTALYQQALLPVFSQALATHALKLRSLFVQMDVHEIACPTPWISYLANINTPEDLKQLTHEDKH